MIAKTEEYRYAPNYAVPPGETLRETIEAKGMSQAELAKRTGRTPKTINEIIQAKAPITAETAMQLEHVLDVPARFWMGLESRYQTALAAQVEREQLAAMDDWVRRFPVRALARLHIIRDVSDKAAQARELLDFFRVASPTAWEAVWARPIVAYRQSPAFTSDPYSIAAWLCMGERAAERIECASFDRVKFREALQRTRELTFRPPEIFQPELVEIFAAAGVAVVFTPELPKTHVSGATKWLTSEKALIQLSLRHKTDDHLWFCFFHEAAHIWLHGKKDIFLHGYEEIDGSDKEEEANKFAAEQLIPSIAYQAILEARDLSGSAILRHSTDLGIPPGVLLGRLQHDGHIAYSKLNYLKKRYSWTDTA